MIDFQYEGVMPDGKPCQGSIRAPNEETARLRLIGQGPDQAAHISLLPQLIVRGSTVVRS